MTASLSKPALIAAGPCPAGGLSIVIRRFGLEICLTGVLVGRFLALPA